MKTIYEKLQTLTNEELIRLSEELRLPTVVEDALIHKVIKDTDTPIPVYGFIGVSQNLGFVLADRLIIAEKRLIVAENAIIYLKLEANEKNN